MKKLLLVCLFAAAAPSFAQTYYFADSGADGAKLAADVDKAQADGARTSAEDAKTRAKLDEARARLEKAAREVAELSTELNVNTQRDIRVITTGGPRRAILGV